MQVATITIKIAMPGDEGNDEELKRHHADLVESFEYIDENDAVIISVSKPVITVEEEVAHVPFMHHFGGSMEEPPEDWLEDKDNWKGKTQRHLDEQLGA